MKKILLLVIVLMLGGLYWWKSSMAVPNISHTATSDYKNISYTIEGAPISLVGGRAEIALAPGSATKAVTQYFGNEVWGDFNADGKNDVAFLLTQSGGGSGTFYYMAVALSGPSGYVGTNAILLGDRIAPQTTEFHNNEIIVNYAERKAGDSMTTMPSVGVSRHFEVKDNILIAIKK